MFIREERRKENEGRRKRGEEELVGRVVDRREKYNKNKRREERDRKRGEEEKNKERIYRRGGRALTSFPP